MDKSEYIEYWIKAAQNDADSMESIFSSGSYDWALFIGHLCLEKILKAAWVKANSINIPPKTHNLMKLADESGINYSEKDSLLLLEVNDFHLETRYPDYKFVFY